MSVRYLNASGTQAVITEIKRRLSLKADSSALSDLAQTVADLVIPTKVSELENDSQFITLNDVADEYATKTELASTNTVVQQHTTAITLLNADDATEGSVDYKIAQALAGVGGSPFIVVASLPTSDPSTEAIYILSTDWSMYIYRDNDFQRLDATLASTVAALVTAVGDSTDGLVKDVADISDTIDTIVGADTGSSMRDVAEDVVSAIPKAITPKGTIEFADLPALADSSIGDMYNIEDSFTTTADFIMGAGTQMQANSNVYVIDAGAGEKKWDVFATGGIADMSAYQTRNLASETAGQATVEGALTALASDTDALKTTVGDSTSGLVKTVADNTSAISDLDSSKQPKTLSTTVTVDDTAQTTVEGALGALATVTDYNSTAISDNADAITAESTAREEADNSLQLQLTKDHAVNVTLYDKEESLPEAIDFQNGIVTSVGASAYCLDTKKWYRVKAVDTATLAITWEEFDGLGSKLVAGDGISIDESTGAISSDIVEFHGTHDEWDALTEEEQAKYNTRDFTDDVDDDDTLQAEIEELQGDVSTLNAYPKIYSVYGQILTSDSAMRGNGTATVTLFANKTCRIEFSAKITTAGTNAGQFNCGLSRNLLKSLNSNIPTITPVKGGVLEWYGTDGIRDKDYLGYAGILEASSGQPYWRFARVYQTSGTIGPYPETECTVGKCYIGTAYGTWA